MHNELISEDEREALYNEVWTEPVSVVAKRYNMTDTGLRKRLNRLGIPIPSNRYWGRVRAGDTVYKPDLPKVIGELRNYVRNYAIRYRPDIDQLPDDDLVHGEELNMLREDTKALISDICSHVKVKGQLREPHKLILDHKEETINRKKKNRQENKPILPLYVTDSCMNRAYRIMDAIIKALEELEGYTRAYIENGNDSGYFVLMCSEFNFVLKDNTRNKRTNKSNEPKFVLSMSAKYGSPFLILVSFKWNIAIIKS